MFSPEIHDAVIRLSKSENVRVVSQWAYPDKPADYLSNKLSVVSSTLEFQRDVMIPLAHVILQRTARGFTYSGIENLTHKPTLFISNHRDIVLDAYFLQVILLENGFDTSQIIAGTNLYVNEFATDIAICNKIIAIGRGGSKRGFGEAMMHISAELRQSLAPTKGQGSSVWIAQRNGRTKDRIDKTDPSIIHMLSMTGSIADYCIVPVTINYELEPNATYKAQHLWHNDHTEAAMEENYMEQMISSILQNKGHVHYSFHPAVDLTCPDGLSLKEYYQLVARRIDEEILSGYIQWPKDEGVERQWQEMVMATPEEVRPYMQTFAPRYQE